MSVDVSVWRADIEHRVAEHVCPYRHDHNPLNADITGGICSACEWAADNPMPPVYIVGEGVRSCPRGALFSPGEDSCPMCRWLPPVGWPSPNETCPHCAGNGHLPDGFSIDVACERCGGSGVTAGTRTELRVRCPRCLGRAKVPGDPLGLNYGYSDMQPCPRCNADGSVLWATAHWRTLPVYEWPPILPVYPDLYGVVIHDVAYLLNNSVEAMSTRFRLPFTAGSVRPGHWVGCLSDIELVS